VAQNLTSKFSQSTVNRCLHVPTQGASSDPSTAPSVSLPSHIRPHQCRSLHMASTKSNLKLRILLVGGGGREHALAWKLAQSDRVEAIHVVPGNGGTVG